MGHELMKITKVEHISSQELINRLRNVTMLKAPHIYPYRDVFISLERISTEYLAPPQNYVLVDELKKVRMLKWALEEHGIDLFNINGYVRIWFVGAKAPVDLLPPVVEESIEADGSVVNIINDGMHRLYMAKMERIIPQVIFIRGVAKDLPYYAFPLRDGWDDVVVEDELFEGYLKKWHRRQDYKSLYRNFNSAFDNVGAPRGYFTKNKKIYES
jgi:hypothetical protein